MIDPQLPNERSAEVPEARLRQFAGLLVVVFGGLFAWSLYLHHGRPTLTSGVGMVLALVVGLPGLAYPASIRPVFAAAVAITRPIGHVVSTVLMGLIYFGLLSPVALLFRLAGRDLLERHPTAAASYWAPKSQPQDLRRYLRQYQRQRSSPTTRLQRVQNNEQLFKQSSDPGLIRDLWDFLRTSGKWWLLPLLAAFLILSLILVLGQSAAAPFIYTLF